MWLRKSDHPIRLGFLGAVLAIVYLGILAPTGFLEGARLRSQDLSCRWRATLFAPPPQTSDLLLITIDEESQKHLGKKWPWGRGVLADFLNRINPHQPRVIVLDLVLTGSTDQDPAQDQALAQAIRRGPPMLLASYLDRQGDPILPYPLFTEAGGLVALINKPRDVDLTVRSLLAGVRLPLQPKPLYATEILASALYRGIPLEKIQMDQHLSHLLLGDLRIPLQPPFGTLAINYQVRPAQLSTVSFWEVMESRVAEERIRGKVVLVGSAHEITHDIYPTSLGLMPGVTISANGILTLLSKRFLRPVPLAWASVTGLLFVVSILEMTFLLPVLQGFLAALSLIGLGIAVGFAGLVLLNWQTESVSAVLLGTGAWLAALIYKYALLAQEVLRLHRQVVTDPLSGSYTGRYFRLRLEGEIPRRRTGAKPHGLLVVQMERPSELLQQIVWQDVQKKFQEAARILRSLKPGAWVGQVEEDHLALFIPGLSASCALDWARQAQETLQPVSGRLGLGIACTDVGAIHSTREWIRRAESAAARSWAQGNRTVELYNPKRDGAMNAEMHPPDPAPLASPFDYMSSELEEKNRALEKALEDLRKAHKEMESHFLEVTKSLIMAMDTKDAYTAGHLERVSRYATRLAEVLHLSREEIEAVREAALLHDIGKLNLPDEVLHKTGQLTPEETAVIRQHLELGAKILDPMKFFRPITTLLYHHHERYDGRGYPHGLTGEFIPSGAQIIAIVDAFDAMTTHRGYNKPLTVQESLAELRQGAGTQFHPVYVETFANLIEKEGPQLAGYSGSSNAGS